MMKKSITLLVVVMMVLSSLLLAACGEITITLDKAEHSLRVGESFTIVATADDEDADLSKIVWTSSNTEVATVANGTVTAVNVGTATISASIDECTVSCVVTVLPAIVEVEAISLDKTSASVHAGDEVTLLATVTPENATDKTVTWESSDKTIATVANGVVTTLKAGTVTVTATAGDKTATCVITVNAIDVWNGTDVATDEEMATILQNDTYTITKASQLAWIAKKANSNDSSYRNTFAGKTFVLANDIDLNNCEWTPIGDLNSYPGKTFSGIFDGNGKTIYNLKSTVVGDIHATAGLFGSAKDATIKNLTIDGAKIVSEHYAAVLVAYADQGTLTTIENCTIKNAIVNSIPGLVGSEYDNGDKAGAIFGYAATTITITDCTVEDSSITAYRDVGGLVGYAVSNCTISNNTIKNTVVTQDDTNDYGKSEESKYVGQIVGRLSGEPTIENNTVENVEIKRVDVVED